MPDTDHVEPDGPEDLPEAPEQGDIEQAIARAMETRVITLRLIEGRLIEELERLTERQEELSGLASVTNRIAKTASALEVVSSLVAASKPTPEPMVASSCPRSIPTKSGSAHRF